MGEGQSTQGEGACFSRPRFCSVILQPDRLPQACLHPFPSLSVATSFILSILLFLLLLSSVPPFSLPRCSCCHPSSLYLHRSIQRSSFSLAVTISSLLIPLASNFLKITVCQLLRRHFCLHFSHIPILLLHQLLSVPFRRSLAPSHSVFPSIFPLSDPVHLLPCSVCRFGSVCSANGMRCSLHSSRIQGAPGLLIRGTLNFGLH